MGVTLPEGNTTKRGKKEMKKSNRTETKTPVLIIAILFFLFGAGAVLYVPFNATPEYEKLSAKETKVQRFYVVRHRRTADDAMLETMEGDKFYVRGTYDLNEMNARLRAGTKIQVKYYKRKAFFVKPILCAEEVVVDGKKICTYCNYDRGNLIGGSIVAIVMFGLSVSFFWGWRKSTKKTREKK